MVEHRELQTEAEPPAAIPPRDEPVPAHREGRKRSARNRHPALAAAAATALLLCGERSREVKAVKEARGERLGHHGRAQGCERERPTLALFLSSSTPAAAFEPGVEESGLDEGVDGARLESPGRPLRLDGGVGGAEAVRGEDGHFEHLKLPLSEGHAPPPGLEQP